MLGSDWAHDTWPIFHWPRQGMWLSPKSSDDTWPLEEVRNYTGINSGSRRGEHLIVGHNVVCHRLLLDSLNLCTLEAPLCAFLNFFSEPTSVFPHWVLLLPTLQCFIQNEFLVKKSETVEIMFALLWLLRYSGSLNNVRVRGADPLHSLKSTYNFGPSPKHNYWYLLLPRSLPENTYCVRCMSYTVLLP